MTLSKQTAAQWMVEMVPKRFQALTLARIKPRSQEQAESIKAVQRYAADILAGGRHSIVLYGAPGGGKTMLAAALWNEVAPRIVHRRLLHDAYEAGTADNVLWVRGDQLIPDYWKDGEHADHRTRAERTFHLFTAGFVVLDDLDKHPVGTWAVSLYGLIDARCCHNWLPTVITMNSTPAELEATYGEQGPPIVDRLKRAGSVFVRMSACKADTGSAGVREQPASGAGPEDCREPNHHPAKMESTEASTCEHE